MIFDAHTLFSDKQTITGTAVSTNVVCATDNVGDGEPVYVSIHKTTPFAGLTSLTVEVQSAAAATGPWTTFDRTEPITLANLNARKCINMGCVPPRSAKFLRLNYTVAGTASAGAVTAGLVLNKQTNGMG